MKGYKRGLRLPLRVDERTLRFGDYLTRALPPPPAVIEAPDYVAQLGNDAGDDSELGMLGNDTVGNCTCAGFGHAAQTWTARNGAEFTITTADVMPVYQAVTGYVPGDPSTDLGADPLAVLKYIRKHGMAGHQLGAFAGMRCDQMHMRQAVAIFGLAYLCLAPPEDLDPTDPAMWSDTSAPPATEEGHVAIIVAYNERGPTFVTWGRRQEATWAWTRRYTVGAIALLSPDEPGPNGRAPNGFDMATLRADLARVTARGPRLTGTLGLGLGAFEGGA
jgi:hypothetical protein